MANTTAIFIDGGANPTGLMLDKQAQQFNFPTGGGGFQSFVFAKEINGPGGKTVWVYRDKSARLNDKLFDQLAADEADKYLNPDKYAKLQGGAQTPAEKELALYKEKYGPLTKS